MTKIAVLGSNSFSGADFVDLVLGETDLTILAISRSAEKSRLFLPYLNRPERARVAFHQLDLNRDLGALTALFDRERPSLIVNFASQSEVAPSWQHPEQWYQTNAVAIAALGNYLKDQAWLARYVHISTPEVYGNCTGEVTEDAAFNPSTPYAASRAAGEWILRLLQRQYQFPVLFVRSANVYGAHQQLHKIAPRTTIYLKLQRPLELHGGGYSRRSFIHIRDVSRGELAILQRGTIGEAYHLATRSTVRIRDLVQRICELRGADFEGSVNTVGERPGHDDAYLLNTDKVRHELGWQDQIGLDEGLNDIADWVDRNWDELRAQPLTYQHKP